MIEYKFKTWIDPEVENQIRQALNYADQRLAKIENIDAFVEVCQLLIGHGFKPAFGAMIRVTTGCQFQWVTLASYKSLADFQTEWPYTSEND